MLNITSMLIKHYVYINFLDTMLSKKKYFIYMKNTGEILY
jgi:hypothetical protein